MARFNYGTTPDWPAVGPVKIPGVQKEDRMSKPVYVLVIGKGHTEAWYRLSKEEQDAIWFKLIEIDKRVGAEWQILCNSRWGDQEVLNWGVVEYPDIESYQKKVEELEKLDWWRYFSAKTILGTKIED